MVLLPGLSTTVELWRDVIDLLPTAGRCRRLELPLGDNVDAIAAGLLKELPTRFPLAGFSFGGYVALALFALAPERVTGLALISTGAGADTPVAAEGRRKLIARATDGDYREADASLTRFLLHPSRLDDRALLDNRSRMSRSYGRDRYIAHQTAALNRPDRTCLLTTIRVPTLLAVGREDRITPVAQHEEMASLIPGARLSIIEQSGHMLPLERPAELARELTAWLN